MVTVWRNTFNEPVSIEVQFGCGKGIYGSWELGLTYFTEGTVISGTNFSGTTHSGTTYSGTTFSGVYPYSDQVTHNSVDFICIQSHIASTANEPGQGIEWTNYWEVSYSHYSFDKNQKYTIPSSGTYGPFADAGTIYRGHKWKICPFSEAWANKYVDHSGQPEKGYYRTCTKVGRKRTYKFMEVNSSEQTAHPITGGQMRFDMRGSVAGYVCDDPYCYYYLSVSSGTRFFEV